MPRLTRGICFSAGARTRTWSSLVTGSAPRSLSHSALDLTSRSRMLTAAPVLLVPTHTYKKDPSLTERDLFSAGARTRTWSSLVTGSAPRSLSHSALDLTSRSRMLTAAPVLLVPTHTYKKDPSLTERDLFSAGARTRTWSLLVRSQTLYPVGLHPLERPQI